VILIDEDNPSSSVTVMDRVHSSLIIVPDLICSPLNLMEVEHSLVLSSSHEATTSSQIVSWFQSIEIVFHVAISTISLCTLTSGALFMVFSLMDVFFEFPASSVTVIDRVPFLLRVSHDMILFQSKDNLTEQFLDVLSVHDATTSSHISNWFPDIRIIFHHVISISDCFRVTVGAIVSSSSLSHEHAVSRLAAVPTQIVDVMVVQRADEVVIVFTDVGKKDETTIHVVVRALWIALFVFSRNLVALLVFLISFELMLSRFVMR
jgi:hypothetical protein